MSGKIIGLPWVEKYRPNKLDDLISHQEIISTIQKFIGEFRSFKTFKLSP